MSKRRPLISTSIKHKVPVNARVLVAVSGGKDSMVLLHALQHAQRMLSLHLEVCHVNHGLRPTSDSDAAYVQGWCDNQGIACHVVTLEARPLGENIEAWARARRYESFKQIMHSRALDVLCTAHTANDVAETLLIKLLANKELTSIEESDPRRRCIRPLLENSREQINEYIERFELGYVEDPTNQDITFVRNRIRHKLLPFLGETFDSSIVWILAERARSLAADSSALSRVAALQVQSIGEVLQDSPAWLARFCDLVREIDEAIQWRIVQQLFTPLFGYSVGEAKARAILNVLVERVGVVDIGAGISLRVGLSGVSITTA